MINLPINALFSFHMTQKMTSKHNVLTLIINQNCLLKSNFDKVSNFNICMIKANVWISSWAGIWTLICLLDWFIIIHLLFCSTDRVMSLWKQIHHPALVTGQNNSLIKRKNRIMLLCISQMALNDTIGTLLREYKTLSPSSENPVHP